MSGLTPAEVIAGQRELVRQFAILKEEAVNLGASVPLKERIDTAAERAEAKLAEMVRLFEAS